ncbi:MAG: HAMP domain-containing histidine kinase [Paludibacter sp.]|nr:HAMP domain-containing histidine kinase [Paludibacter sp.]
MSKIYFLYFLIAWIIPLLIYPQMETFNELLKADIMKQSSVLKSRSNFSKVYLFLIKRNRSSSFLNSLKESKSKERLFDATLNQKQIKAFNIEKQSNQSQMNDYLYLVIALSLLLLGSGFVYNKHVKGTNMILHQKSKLNELNDTKDKLLTIICHDLRSSVHALKDSNAQLKSSLENKNYEELDQLLHKNTIIANGAYSLLDNILHWALLQTKQLYFHKDSVHLFSIVQQIEYNFRPLFAEKALVFENHVSENCFIYVDLDSLKIILRNLLDNAIKFSNKNGKISILTQETDSDFCTLIIEDTGKGIDQNTITELLIDNELLCKKTILS